MKFSINLTVNYVLCIWVRCTVESRQVFYAYLCCWCKYIEGWMCFYSVQCMASKPIGVHGLVLVCMFVKGTVLDTIFNDEYMKDWPVEWIHGISEHYLKIHSSYIGNIHGKAMSGCYEGQGQLKVGLCCYNVARVRQAHKFSYGGIQNRTLASTKQIELTNSYQQPLSWTQSLSLKISSESVLE